MGGRNKTKVVQLLPNMASGLGVMIDSHSPSTRETI